MRKFIITFSLMLSLACLALTNQPNAVASRTAIAKSGKEFTMKLEEFGGKFAQKAEQAIQKQSQAPASKDGKKHKGNLNFLMNQIQEKIKQEIGDVTFKYNKEAKGFTVINNTQYDNATVRAKLKVCVAQTLQHHEQLKKSGVKGSALRKQWNSEVK